MTAALALRAAVQALRKAGVPDAAGDARRLLAHALGIGTGRVTLVLEDPLPDPAAELFAIFVTQRLRRQPVAQIIGERLFWGRPFRVTRDVLDPRPETEVLVAAALAGPFTRLLDLGTGSGAIAVSLLAERGGAQGVATDVSPAALRVARFNAGRLGVAGRLALQEADWFAGVAGRFDLIVSNPPYIAADEMAGLAPEVRDWEPALALTPGGDGLDAYRRIAAGAPGHLLPGGRLLLEIGPTQGAAVAALVRAAGLAGVAVLPDLDGRDRVVIANAA
jgi:release factor glutamine methyltransferase